MSPEPDEPRPSRSPRRAAFWSNLSRYALAILLVALGAAAFAIAFRSVAAWVFERLYRQRDVLAAFESLPLYARLLLPPLGGALAGLCGAWAARFKRVQGVGDVMEAIVLGTTRISLRLSLLKALGSFFALTFGGSVGREGPLIQFGGGLGGNLGRWFGLRDVQTRGLIAAGTAAGFAAAYNTPLAAVLFVVEVVTGVIALDVVLPAIIATPIATALTRLAIGGGPIYGLRSFGLRSDLELAVHALLGLCAGLLGPAFMVLLARSEAWFQKLPGPKPARAAAGGLVVGLIALALPQVTGNGYEAINRILDGKVALGLLFALLLSKAVATSASVSSGSPGGVFTPSLFLGAALGGVFGDLLLRLPLDAPLGAAEAFALVGMAAMTAATTHAPVMAAALVFELSGDYSIVLPLLTATALATLLSRRLHPLSIYGSELHRRNLSWEMTLSGRRMHGP